jgi:hypothetical protein
MPRKNLYPRFRPWFCCFAATVVGKLGFRITQPTIQVNLVGLLLVFGYRQFKGSLTASGFLCPDQNSIEN